MFVTFAYFVTLHYESPRSNTRQENHYAFQLHSIFPLWGNKKGLSLKKQKNPAVV